MEKMAALRRRHAQEGLLRVSLAAHIKAIHQQTQKRKDSDCDHDDEAATDDDNNNSENDDGYSTTSSSGSKSDRCHRQDQQKSSDISPVDGTPDTGLVEIGTSDVKLSPRIGESSMTVFLQYWGV